MPLDPTLGELAGQQQWSSQDISSMTHQPEQPNPAAPYVQGTADAWKNISLPIWNAMTTPPGMTPSDLEQQARTAAGTAFNLTTAGMGLGTKFGEAGALGIMGGSRGFRELAARSGDTSMIDLEMAKQMEAQGIPRSQILAAKEWFKENPSGIWNKEIFDNPATMDEFKIPLHANYQNQRSTVGEILNHPDLYKVYPHLEDMPLTFKNDPAAYARNNHGLYYHPDIYYKNGHIVINNPHRMSAPFIKETLLHELQHAVDVYEGRKFSNATGLSIDDYFKLIEEVRARNTEFRSRYTPEQLKKASMAPWQTMRQMAEPIRETAVTLPPP